MKKASWSIQPLPREIQPSESNVGKKIQRAFFINAAQKSDIRVKTSLNNSEG